MTFDLSPEQYHAGVDKLWEALKLTTVQDKDVFTLAAERIEHLTDTLEKIAFHGTDAFREQDADWWRSIAHDCICIAARGLK